MNQWWFKLYTLHNLKKTFFTFAVISVLFFIGRFLSQKNLEEIGYLGFLIIFISKFNFANSFEGNIELHKLHVNFNDLRTALLKDKLITSAFAFLLACLTLPIAYSMKGDYFSLGVFLYGMISLIPSSYLTSKGSKQYLIFNTKERNFFLFVLFAMGFSIIFVFALLSYSVFMLTSPATPMVVFGLSIYLAKTIFKYKAMFNLEIHKGGYKTFLKYFSKGFGYSVAVYILFVAVTRPFINSDLISDETRLTFVLNQGKLSPDLDLKHARNLILKADDSYFDQIAIYESSPGIGDVPVTQIFLKMDPVKLIYFVRHGNPSQANLEYLAKKFASIEKPNIFDRALLNSIAKSWKAKGAIPDYLVEQKISKEEIKKTRVPAGMDLEE